MTLSVDGRFFQLLNGERTNGGAELFCLKIAEIRGFNRNKFARAEQGRQFVSQLGALAETEGFEPSIRF